MVSRTSLSFPRQGFAYLAYGVFRLLRSNVHAFTPYLSAFARYLSYKDITLGVLQVKVFHGIYLEFI